MSSFKVLFCIAFGLLALSSTTDASCSVCSSTSYAACINETAFLICFDGQIASTQMETCNENMVCTDTQGVCQPNVPGVELGCTISHTCNDCSGNRPFTCISQTQFAFCDGTGNTGHVSTCEKGKFCSLQNFDISGEICGLSCLVEATCQNTEPIPPPVGDWKETCSQIAPQASGYYINIHDSTCKTFVYCETLNGKMTSVKYDCGAKYFDTASQKCIDIKPVTCT